MNILYNNDFYARSQAKVYMTSCDEYYSSLDANTVTVFANKRQYIKRSIDTYKADKNSLYEYIKRNVHNKIEEVNLYVYDLHHFGNILQLVLLFRELVEYNIKLHVKSVSSSESYYMKLYTFFAALEKDFINGDDISIRTLYDRHVDASARRYKGILIGEKTLKVKNIILGCDKVIDIPSKKLDKEYVLLLYSNYSVGDSRKIKLTYATLFNNLYKNKKINIIYGNNFKSYLTEVEDVLLDDNKILVLPTISCLGTHANIFRYLRMIYKNYGTLNNRIEYLEPSSVSMNFLKDILQKYSSARPYISDICEHNRMPMDYTNDIKAYLKNNCTQRSIFDIMRAVTSTTENDYNINLYIKECKYNQLKKVEPSIKKEVIPNKNFRKSEYLTMEEVASLKNINIKQLRNLIEYTPSKVKEVWYIDGKLDRVKFFLWFTENWGEGEEFK